jgi:hypothetical protein
VLADIQGISISPPTPTQQLTAVEPHSRYRNLSLRKQVCCTGTVTMKSPPINIEITWLEIPATQTPKQRQASPITWTLLGRKRVLSIDPWLGSKLHIDLKTSCICMLDRASKHFRAFLVFSTPTVQERLPRLGWLLYAVPRLSA